MRNGYRLTETVAPWTQDWAITRAFAGAFKPRRADAGARTQLRAIGIKPVARLFQSALLVIFMTAMCVHVGAPAAFAQDGRAIEARVEIDATDLPRKLLRGTVRLPVSRTLRAEDGTIALWYPKWIPGTHGPGGPVQNIAGLYVHNAKGEALEWEREPGEVYRINVHAPRDTRELVITIRYITNQDVPNSRGVDSYGSELIGFISPNTILMYPDPAPADELIVRPSLRLPKEWSAASALREQTHDDDGDENSDSDNHNDNDNDNGNHDRARTASDGASDNASQEDWRTIEYEPTTLERFVDSPIMLGRYMRVYDLVEEEMKGAIPPHRMPLFSEAKSVIEIPDDVHQAYQRMVTQAALLFDSHHFESFDVLTATTNALGRNGLEHLSCTFNIIGQRSFQSLDRLDGWDQMLLPHEYVHSWCGKYRRPAGMATDDFHTPKDTALLWVYEGLTQYLGRVIEVRSGLMTEEEFEWSLYRNIRSARHRQGRDWRPLADTGAASHILRAGSRNWAHLRRGQDYYNEGALLFLEADAKIRNLTEGDKSLDDFCRRFFAYRPDAPNPRPFDRREVIDALNAVVAYDWETFIHERIDEPKDEFGLGLLNELGYQLHYNNTPPEGPGRSRVDPLDARDSIGATFSSNGTVREVLLDSPADQAGLGPDMRIVGVGEYTWSRERLIDAIAESARTGAIEVMLVSGDKYITKTIEYDGGPRFMTLVKSDEGNTILADILKPRAK